MSLAEVFCAGPMLEDRHRDELKKRGISADFAIRNGVFTAADNELRRLSFDAGLPLDQRKQGLQGILFTYRKLDASGDPIYRLKPDLRFSLNGRQAKYLSRKGDPQRPYFPQTTTPEHAKDTRVNVIITEGEFKALSLAQNIVPICSRKTCVIGLQGVNGGWRRDRITITRPDGTREDKKVGHPHLADELEEWEWAKRVVYICFDSDVGSKAQAAEFKKNKHLGAMGAEYTLAQLLRAKGADVRIVILPPNIDGSKYGADDFIVARGSSEFLKLLYNNWVAERDPDEILYKQKSATIQLETASGLVASAPAKPDFVVEKILPSQGVMMLAGSPGVGKSAIALNAAWAVASGQPFLGLYPVRRGRVVYIQTELPRWSLAERLKSFGELPQNLYVWSPESLKLNFWEPDGFNKRRETGSREMVFALIDVLKSYSADLVVFDPLSDIHSLSSNDAEGMRHVMDVLRYIARAVGCAVCMVHHHRKTGARETRYEGGDDMLGSIVIQAKIDAGLSLYSYKRADETCRYKLVFTKLRHSEQLKPLEILRWEGQNSFKWKAAEWAEGDISPKGDAILDVLQSRFSGAATAKELIKASGLSAATFYRQIGPLESCGKIAKDGNLYRFSLRLKSPHCEDEA